MPKKYLLALGIVAVVVVAVIVGVVWFNEIPAEPASKTRESSNAGFSPEVEMVLERKINLIRELLKDPVIIESVRQANAAHATTTLQEIEALDARWRNAPDDDPFIQTLLTNALARRLFEFQEANPGFSEIFVTDARGLNVGQTNKTTDYYQADEDWWVDSFNKGAGRTFHGAIEFDESAQAEAVALYVPVSEPETNQSVGVTKAILNISAITLEL